MLKEVSDLMSGPWASIDQEKSVGRARALLDTFISGDIISVRLPPSKNVGAQLAQLENRFEEVWEFRSREPKPGLRVFGRFLKCNHFLATNYASRCDLKEDSDWLREKQVCKRRWRTFFPSYNPLSGVEVHDYVSNAFTL
jgi:hypothetical protein